MNGEGRKRDPIKKDTSDKIMGVGGVKDHKRPECSNRIASVRNTGHPKGRILHGCV